MDEEKIKNYTEENRKAWNEVMPRHREGRSDKYLEIFADKQYVTLDNIEKEALDNIGVLAKN